jgi:hypothetical protein
MQRDINTDTPLPPDEPAAANPPDGAIIDFYLARAASGPVTLEILDSHGQQVRKFSSDDKAPVSEADLAKQLIPLYWLKPFRVLPADAGMHRWVWDLHYPAPDSPRHEYPIAAIPGDTPRHPLGPTALPGSYTARLVANGKSYTASFTIKIDPRVKITPAAIEKKFELEVRLSSLVSQTSQAVMQAGSIHDPLEKLAKQATGAVHDSVQAFQNKLTEILGAPNAAPDAVTLPRVNGQLSTLYTQIWHADAAPTTAQSEAVVAAERDTSEVLKKWDALKSSDLPQLNRALHDANLPPLKFDSGAHEEDSGMDEE